MKTMIFFLTGILLQLYAGSVKGTDLTEKGGISQPPMINVVASPDLDELVTTWVSKYNSVNPEVKVRITEGTPDHSFSEGTDNIGLITNKAVPAINFENTWSIVLGREIIVPVMNSGNPLLNEILEKGIMPSAIGRIVKGQEKLSWGALVAGENNIPLHLYLVDDDDIRNSVAHFLAMDRISSDRISVGSREEVIRLIQNDPYALGFCKFSQIMGAEQNEMIENIRLMPIDKNANGRLDYMEDIYNDPDVLLRGVWLGKFPQALYSYIYAVSKVKPSRESDLVFLSWIVTEGQQYMNNFGFSGLVNHESLSQFSKINTPPDIVRTETKAGSPVRWILFILSACLLAVPLARYLFRLFRQKPLPVNISSPRIPVFNENAVVIPRGLFFDKSHTWAFMEKDGTVTIGMDDFLQHVTGPITRIEMLKQGERIKRGNLLLTLIQSGKRLNLYAPVSGTIIENNEGLTTKSSILNHAPYGEGWVYRLEPSKWFKEIEFLEIAEKYSKWLKMEFARLKDFLMHEIKPADPEYASLVLQDGGELKDGILADFGPEIWEEFQTRFIDTCK